MTEHSQKPTEHDREAQHDYADQPTYQQQSNQSQHTEPSAQPSQGYREQDYGGESTYDPEESD